jgi:cytochrome c oxidase cbb3-type subunit 3
MHDQSSVLTQAAPAQPQQDEAHANAGVDPITGNPLTDHAYDGIQEYDNPTPGWWTWLWIGTILFSALYFFVTQMAGGELSPNAQYARAKVADQLARLGDLGDVKPDSATVLRLSNDDRWRSVGQSIFQSNCVQCHGRNGEGINGPNMTDDWYINVKQPSDIPEVILNGRKAGAMPSFKTMDERERILVAAYIASLRGKNLPGRPHEGNEAPKWN